MWALGVVLYEMCTGARPFDARNQGALILKIIQGKYPPLPAHYSPPLRDLVDQLLARDTDRRPTAGEVLAQPAVVERAAALGLTLPAAPAAEGWEEEGSGGGAGEGGAGEDGAGGAPRRQSSGMGDGDEEPELASETSFHAVGAGDEEGGGSAMVAGGGRAAPALRPLSPLEAEADERALATCDRIISDSGRFALHSPARGAAGEGWRPEEAGGDGGGGAAQPARRLNKWFAAEEEEGAEEPAPLQAPVQPQSNAQKRAGTASPAAARGASGGGAGAQRAQSRDGAARKGTAAPAAAPTPQRAPGAAGRPPSQATARPSVVVGSGGGGGAAAADLRGRRIRKGDPTGGVRPRKVLPLSEEAQKAAAEAASRVQRVTVSAYRPATSNAPPQPAPAPAPAPRPATQAAAQPVLTSPAASAEARRHAAEVAALPDMPKVHQQQQQPVMGGAASPPPAQAAHVTPGRAAPRASSRPDSRPSVNLLLATTAALQSQPPQGEQLPSSASASSSTASGGSLEATQLGASGGTEATTGEHVPGEEMGEGEGRRGVQWRVRDEGEGGSEEGEEGAYASDFEEEEEEEEAAALAAAEEEEEALASLLQQRDDLTEQARALQAACAEMVPADAAARLLSAGSRSGGGESAEGGSEEEEEEDTPTLPGGAYLLLYRLEYCLSRLAEVNAELAAAGLA